MPKFLIQLAYKGESWAAQLKEPHNRIEAVRPAIEKVGGKFESAFYCFGEYDLLAISDFPDNQSAAAAAIAFASGGAIKSIKTTPLMTIEEGMEALRKGSKVAAAYRAVK
jgi:uncharacterized protein with GYD domain